MIEMLVMIACLSQQGCDKVADAYYKDSPKLQEQSQHYELLVRNQLGDKIKYIEPIAATMMINQTAEVKLTGDFYYLHKPDQNGLLLKWPF